MKATLVLSAVLLSCLSLSSIYAHKAKDCTRRCGGDRQRCTKADVRKSAENARVIRYTMTVYIDKEHKDSTDWKSMVSDVIDSIDTLSNTAAKSTDSAWIDQMYAVAKRAYGHTRKENSGIRGELQIAFGDGECSEGTCDENCDCEDSKGVCPCNLDSAPLVTATENEEAGIKRARK